MNVYIVASQDNVPFAERLLENIGHVHFYSKFLINEVPMNINDEIHKRIARADVILVIIDKKFNESMLLKMELDIAMNYSLKSEKHLLFPVVLDNASVPSELEKMIYVNCASNSEDELCKAKSMLEKMLLHKKNSIKKKNINKVESKTSYMIILTIAIEFFAMFLVISKEQFLSIGYMQNGDIMSLLLEIITLMLAVVALFTSYYSVMKRRRKEDDEEELNAYSRRLKKAIVADEIIYRKDKSLSQDEKKQEVDALGRMMINLEDIKEFYTWSQKQAKASFVLAVVMCILGFALMIIAITLPIIFKLSFQMSLIPAVGGVITELIAGTALVVYKNSLAQLNHYHKALHEDERFLSSVNLVGKFSTVEAQDDMLKEIIRSEIKMNLIGQRHDYEVNLGRTNKNVNQK